MGASAGAVAAAMAAAHAERIRNILDAYRTAPATTRVAARSPTELGLGDHQDALEELISAKVLVPGERAGTWYLDEKAYIAYRSRGEGRQRIVLVVIAALVAVLIAVVIYMKER